MKITLLPLIAALSLLPAAALAEKADREKPINIQADRVDLDDLNKVQVFTGNVIITQGTMQLRTAHLVVTQDEDGFQKGVATGGENGLAYFKQKREGKDEYVEGEGERIVHDARADVTEFFVRAWVKNGQDEVRGKYIYYEAINEKYLVTTGTGEKKAAIGMPQARVRAIIQPKSKNPAPAPDPAPAVPLKPSRTVSPLPE